MFPRLFLAVTTLSNLGLAYSTWHDPIGRLIVAAFLSPIANLLLLALGFVAVLIRDWGESHFELPIVIAAPIAGAVVQCLLV